MVSQADLCQLPEEAVHALSKSRKGASVNLLSLRLLELSQPGGVWGGLDFRFRRADGCVTLGNRRSTRRNDTTAAHTSTVCGVGKDEKSADMKCLELQRHAFVMPRVTKRSRSRASRQAGAGGDE